MNKTNQHFYTDLAELARANIEAETKLAQARINAEAEQLKTKVVNSAYERGAKQVNHSPSSAQKKTGLSLPKNGKVLASVAATAVVAGLFITLCHLLPTLQDGRNDTWQIPSTLRRLLKPFNKAKTSAVRTVF